MTLKRKIFDRVKSLDPPEQILENLYNLHKSEDISHKQLLHELTKTAIQFDHKTLLYWLLENNYIQVNMRHSGKDTAPVGNDNVSKSEMCSFDTERKYIDEKTKKRILKIALDGDNVELLQTVANSLTDRDSILQEACSSGSQNCIEYALNHKGDWCLNLEKKDSRGMTLLSHFVQEHDVKMINLLIQHGAQVKTRLTRTERTCLHLACRTIAPALPDILEILIFSGSDLTATDIYNQTPLEMLLTHMTLHTEEYVGKRQNIDFKSKLQIIKKGIKILLSYGAPIDPRKDPKICENIMTLIQTKLLDLTKELANIETDNMDEESMIRMKGLCMLFTEITNVLKMCVRFGAVINYEHFSYPREVNETKALFYSRRALCDEKLDMYILYKSIKDYFYIILVFPIVTNEMRTSLEPAFCTLTRLLLCHGLSCREKEHILDHVKMHSVLNLMLNALSHNQYQIQLTRILQRKSNPPDWIGWTVPESLKRKAKQPRTLKQQSRIIIHKSLGKMMTHKAEQLEVPEEVSRYILSFED